ncbi:MAG: hypothetical protein QOF20_2149, partial [Acidimicrobiaceae bacterium]|nr:hypothetical protein [Acidimicrobiaceae bacterium]
HPTSQVVDLLVRAGHEPIERDVTNVRTVDADVGHPPVEEGRALQEHVRARAA